MTIIILLFLSMICGICSTPGCSPLTQLQYYLILFWSYTGLFWSYVYGVKNWNPQIHHLQIYKSTNTKLKFRGDLQDCPSRLSWSSCDRVHARVQDLRLNCQENWRFLGIFLESRCVWYVTINVVKLSLKAFWNVYYMPQEVNSVSHHV